MWAQASNIEQLSSSVGALQALLTSAQAENTQLGAKDGEIDLLKKKLVVRIGYSLVAVAEAWLLCR